MHDQTMPPLTPTDAKPNLSASLEKQSSAAPLPPHPSTIGAYNPVLEGDKGDAQIQHALDSAVNDLVENTRTTVSSSANLNQQGRALSDTPPTLPPPSLSVTTPTQEASVVAAAPPTTHVEQLTSDVASEVKEVIREDVSLISKAPQAVAAPSSKRWRIALYIAGGLGIFLLGMVASVAVLTLL